MSTARERAGTNRRPNTADPVTGLNARQRRFVDEYLIEPNAAQAYARAGYKTSDNRHGSTVLMATPVIRAAIQKGMDARAVRMELKADDVLRGIQRTIARCEQVEPVVDKSGKPVMVETPNGELVPAYKFDATNALKGYELLGRHLKLFTDKVEHTGSVDFKPAEMTPEQRQAEIKALLRDNPGLASVVGHTK